jgi:predicted Zn-dependent protease
MVNFQRANETEADLIAVKIASSAGCDPAGLAAYIRRVQQDPPSARLDFPFPSRDQRVQDIEQVIQALPPKTYVASSDFSRVYEEVRRVLPLPPNTPKPTLQR